MKTEITRRVLQNDHSCQNLVDESHPGNRSQDLGRYRVWLIGKKVVAVWCMMDGQFTLSEMS
jgi:hypothetical protein